LAASLIGLLANVTFLNERLDRTEFMPFAPMILEEKAAEVFDVNSVNAYACAS
jgi:predicted NodU family carbamoyl transferase